MAKGVVAQSLMRMFRDYQGTGPLTLRNSNVWCYGWSNAIGQSAFMVWGTNEAPWTLTYTNPGASSKFVDAFATPISVHVPTLAVTRMPRFLFTDTVWETMTNLLSGASITVATDTEPPTCRITICPTGRVETNSDVIIKFMGTDQQTMPSEGDPELLKFTWRLLGYSDTWTTPQALLSTVYSGLPAGHYVFQVRSVDNAGNYSPVDSRSFSVGTNFVRTTKVTAGAATAGTFYVGYPGVAFVTVSADDASQHDLRITQDLGTGAYTLYVNQAVSSGVAEDILLQAQDLTNHRLLLRLLGGSYAPELEQTNTVGTPSSIVLSDGFRGHALSAHFDGTNYLISVAQ